MSSSLAEIARDHHTSWCSQDFTTVSKIIESYRDPLHRDVITGVGLPARCELWTDLLGPGDWQLLDIVGGEQTAVSRWSVSLTPQAGAAGGSQGSTRGLTGTDVFTREDGRVLVDRMLNLDQLELAMNSDIAYQQRATEDQEFGTSSRLRTPKPGPVGALALTLLGVRGPGESQAVDQLSVEIFRALRPARGFLGAATFDVGERKYTLSTFRDTEALRSVHNRAHQRAVRKMFNGNLCTDATITTWVPHSFNSYIRCPECQAVASPGQLSCCDRPLPEQLLL